MPFGERRVTRAKRLIQHYVNAKKAWEKCLQHRKATLRQSFQYANQVIGRVDSPASLSSLSDMSTSSKGSGPDWWDDTSQMLFHGFSDATASTDLELGPGPELAFLGDESELGDESPPSDDSDLDSDLLDSLDLDADDEFSDPGSTEEEDEEEPIQVNLDKWAQLRKWVLGQLSDMYAHRYVSILLLEQLRVFFFLLNNKPQI
jgi:hypothetical protein